MAITVTCQCGKKLGVKDDMAGKKVKCPACQSVLTVPMDGGPGGGGAPSAAAADEPAARSSAPKAGSGGGTGGGSNKKMLLIGGGVGLLLLSCCCLGGGGVAFFLFFTGGPEKKIIGKWVADTSAKKGDKDEIKTDFPGFIEFKADGTLVDSSPLTPILAGKWKRVDSKDDTVTVEVSDSSNTTKLDIKIIDATHLRITEQKSKIVVAVKKAT